MELKEAYELRRREVLSLTRKIAKLEKQISQGLPIAKNEDLENQIRSRDYTITCLKKELRISNSRYDTLKKNYSRIENECFQFSTENDILRKENQNLSKDNTTLLAKVAVLEAEIINLNGTNENLQKKLNTNFENSSLPSSALPFRKKISNNRKPSSKSHGAQTGHPGSSAKRLSPTLEPIYIETPESVTSNPNLYPTGKTITKQLVDISIHISVRDYIADEYRNRINGSRWHAPFPSGIVNPVNYGPSLKAFAFLLNNYYNVSIEKTKQCISDFTNGVISLSTGTISNLAKEFSTATQEERNKIFSRLLHSKVLYSDATVSNVNGKRNTVLLCTNNSDVLYSHSKHKGYKGLDTTPLKSFEGTIVHDHDISYYAYGKSHQECLAHILRYLVAASENEPKLTWHTKMHSLLQEMIHSAKEYNRKLSNKTIYDLERRYNLILAIAEKEYKTNPPPKYFPDGYNLFKRLRKYQKSTLFFLRHPDVDFTNNLSERELRKFKRKQKQAVVLRSFDGGQRICDALTIIESARLKNQNILWITQSAFTK